MARNKPTGKTVWVLLLICLGLGFAGSEAGAEVRADTQVIVLLDISADAKDAKAPGLASQAAALLVHLLKEQDCLGLVVAGEPADASLPPAPLTPGHRRRALQHLARLKPGAGRTSLAQAVQQCLGLFHPENPPRRVLFLLSEASPHNAPQKGQVDNAEIKQAAAQACTAGVEILAAAPAPPAAPLQALISETGGRLWEVKRASDLHLPCLKLYEYLDQPQEAPIDGEHFLIDPRVGEAVVAAARPTPGKGVMLITPQGVRLNPGARAKNIRWTGGQAYDLITISPPQPGVWTLAKARLADSRVFLSTDLTLSAAGPPRQVGEDEALWVSAALSGTQEVLKGLDSASGTLLFAELAMPATVPVTAKLRPQGPGVDPTEPPGALVGRFAPPHGKGEGTLKLLALGKTLQRLISVPIAVTEPWYQATMDPAGAQGPPVLRFRPAPDRRLEGAGGTLTVKSSQGGLAGVLIKPAPGGDILLARPADCPDDCLADLHLKGTAPGGRPLEIASASRPLESSPKVADKNVEGTPPQTPNGQAQGSPPTASPAPKRRWFWLILSVMGIMVFLFSAFLLLRLRGEGKDSKPNNPNDGSGKNILSLKAQVEILTKEKAQLQEALKDKNNQVASLEAEKAELQESLDRIRAKTQESIKSVEELEKKLEEAEKDAQDMRQEYMALYARNQQEKETLKKN